MKNVKSTDARQLVSTMMNVLKLHICIRHNHYKLAHFSFSSPSEFISNCADGAACRMEFGFTLSLFYSSEKIKTSRITSTAGTLDDK